MSVDLEPALCALAVDYWKLLRAYERLVADETGAKAARLSAQARYADGRLTSHLDDAGMMLMTFDGQDITPEIPVIAVNADDLASARQAIVSQTLEPAIVAGPRVLAMGRVIACEGDA